MSKLFLLLLLSSVSFSLSASLHVPERLGSIAVLNTPAGFAVLKDKKIHHLGPEAVDSTLRKMDFKQRNMYLMNGDCLALNQISDGDYVLRTSPKLKGGGPILAATFYWVTKVGSWTCVAISSVAVIGGAVTSMVATGGATVAPTATVLAAAAGVIVKGAITTAVIPIAAPVIVVATATAVTNTVMLTAAGITTAAAVSGTAATVSTLATAQAVTVAVATGTAGKVGIAAGIEAAACGAFTVGMAFPWW